MARYADQTATLIEGQSVPLAGVSVYVYNRNGTLATLTEDGGGSLANPVTSDQYGNFHFNTADGLYDLSFHYGGKEIYRENGVQVGVGPVLPADILSALSQSSAAALIGEIGAGIGAIARTVQAKLRETISGDDFGTADTGLVNDQPAIVLTQNARAAAGGGEILFTHGRNAVASPIPMRSGITYKGSGSSGIDQVATVPGAQIYPTGGSAAFVNANTLIDGTTLRHAIKAENLFVYGHLGDAGDLFDWSLSGEVAKTELAGCTFIQENANKHIINGTAAGGVLSIWMQDCDYQYQTANSVSPLYFASPTVNSIVVERTWSTCTTAAASGVPSIHIESTNAVGPAINCIVRDCVFELPGGGSVKMLSAANSGIENCAVYDLTAGVVAHPQFEFSKGASGPPANNCWLKGVRSTVGTSGNPDCKIDCSVSGQAGFVIENCSFSYLDGGSATPVPGMLIIGSDITHFQNCAYTRLGASPALDLHFGTTDPSSKEYTIWNGYAGNNQGYLCIYQNGAYKWAFNPSGGFQVGGTINSPNINLPNTGAMAAVSVTLSSYAKVTPCTVAQLPAAATAGAGARATVSDANAATFYSNVAGGGANIVPVFSDGTNWKIG